MLPAGGASGRAGRLGLLLLGLLGPVLLVGCGTDQVTADRTSAAATSAVPTSSATPTGEPSEPATDEEGGIGYDEASEDGVLTAEYDAVLVESARGPDGRVVLVLRNIGSADDGYVVTLEDAGRGARVDPAELELAAGDEAELVVQGAARGEIVVVSRGRGDEVARLPLS